MMRQYVAFAAVILIAIFIFSQVEWSSLPAPNFNDTAGGQRIETGEGIDSSNQIINFRDLSIGGVNSASRPQNSEPLLSVPEIFTQTTAATSSPVTATSTPLQAGRKAQSTYSGVNVQFSKLE